jgi:hypothetical protein
MQIYMVHFSFYLSISILLTNYAFLANHGIKRACFVTHDKDKSLFFVFFFLKKIKTLISNFQHKILTKKFKTPLTFMFVKKNKK